MAINIVSTWLYISPVGENIKYYQVKGKSSSKRFIEKYIKNIVCFFWSSRLYNGSNTKYILFVNTDLPKFIDDFNLIDYLNRHDIQIIKLENISCVSPPNYYKAWNSQFVIIDILKWFSFLRYDFNAIILDNDCLIINNLDNIFNDLNEKSSILNFEINYNDDIIINGLSNNQLRDLYNIYHNENTLFKIKYFGGEFVGFNSKIIAQLYKESMRLYLLSLERFKINELRYNEEAQLLSSVYHKLGFITPIANKYIKRIWTNHKIFTNIDGSESELLIWHLPSEKGRGFNKLFKKIKRNYNYTTDIIELQSLFRLKINFIQFLFYFIFKKFRTFSLFLLRNV